MLRWQVVVSGEGRTWEQVVRLGTRTYGRGSLRPTTGGRIVSTLDQVGRLFAHRRTPFCVGGVCGEREGWPSCR